tara:strand:- start:16539 stop:17567 length:1029 start_codon:yes stop_codon:yes gene_type:complete
VKNIITLALDSMGGDIGPSVVVPAAESFLTNNADSKIILVGDEIKIEAILKNKSVRNRIEIVHASQKVEMDEAPASALRQKKDSSMRVAINLVKSGLADACVSAGNTGALMATARFVLKTMPQIDRPAICTAIPAIDGRTWMLDLGANLNSTAEHLFQFAVMGSELVVALDNIKRPNIGLLNVGEEDNKGIDEVKRADKFLEESDLNYCGYIEGDDIYLKENLDVVICDGFVGNVSLKTSEGLAKMISSFLRAEFNKNIFSKITAIFALPLLKGLRQKIDPRRYNGACLLGLQGIVVKSHGNADSTSFENALRMAKKEVIADIANRIAEKVSTQVSRGVGSR